MRGQMKRISKVTVLGGNGTVGSRVAAIFASLGGAEVHMVGRSLDKLDAARSVAAKSVRAESVIDRMYIRTYDELEKCVLESDIVFEAVTENLETKCSMLNAAAPFLSENTLLCTGTSGLSVNTMAETLPEKVRNRLVGAHFFNPPYAMSLCEVIPTRYTSKAEIDEFVAYLEERLLRKVVIVSDTPAFLANRVGFQVINAAMRLAAEQRYAGGIAFVDALMGPYTGRSMPPIATANFVGLDVHLAVVDNIHEGTHDWAHDDFEAPPFCRHLVERGLLGRKSHSGAYAVRTFEDGGRKRLAYDMLEDGYLEIPEFNLPFRDRAIAALSVGNYEEAARAIITDGSPEAIATMKMLLDYVAYGVTCALNVAKNVSDVDIAMADWLSSVDDVGVLIGERCDLPAGELVRVIGALQPSQYDYRPFLRARE